MVDKRMVRQLLKSYFKTTGKITIYDEGLVSCTGNVILKSQKQHTRLPLAFSEVGRNFHGTNNKLTTLEGLPAVHGTLYLSYSPILPLLRCLLAKKVEFVPKLTDNTVETIFNRYAGKGKRVMFDCQKELEDAGFLENARW